MSGCDFRGYMVGLVRRCEGKLENTALNFLV